MNDHDVQTSPQAYARVGGVLYLIIIVLGIFGELFIRSGRIVPGDATATAENIRSSELLWRVGIAGQLFYLTCAVVLALIFYVLLRPVSRDLALLAAFFNLVAISLEAANMLHLLTALFPLGDAGYLRAFEPAQLHALTHLSTRTFGHGFGISLIFFGVECIILGYLIFRSGYLPRVVGVLMQIAGVCYLTSSFSLIVAPTFHSLIVPVVLLPVFIGETSLCLWLIAKGVNVEKWKLRAGAGPVRRASAAV